MNEPADQQLARLTTEIRAEQAARWRRGECVPAEHYFQAHAELRDAHDAAIEIIYAEYLLRVEEGRRPAVAEFALRFPWLAETLTRQFELEEALVSIKSQRISNAPSHDETAKDGGDKRTARNASPGLSEPATRPTEIRHRVSRFELLERIGAGSFGVVWKAHDVELDRVVAVKIPHAGQLSLKADAAQFVREGRSAARLRHPGIVSLHEVGEYQGIPFLVSDFVEGTTLAGLPEDEQVDFRQMAQLVRQVAEALDYAHRMGVVHRDVKPSNIVLERIGERSTAPGQAGALGMRALLLDFGLARCDDAKRTASRDGDLIGTPAYMSPEQAAGASAEVGPRSDIYSLGVVLYELLACVPPFRGNSAAVLEQVLREEPLPPRRLNRLIPIDLETICQKAMAKEPLRRYPTAGEMADDLNRFLTGVPIRARPIGTIERSWRWAKRHPSTAGLMSAVAGCLVLLAVGASVAATRIAASRDQEIAARELAQQKAEDESRALAEAANALVGEQEHRRAAEESLQRAEVAEANARRAAELSTAEAATAQKVSLFLESLFGTLDPFSLYDSQFAAGSERLNSADLLPVSPELTTREILDRAAQRVKQELDDQPAVQFQLLLAIANAYSRLQIFDEAISTADEALKLATTAWGESDLRMAEARYNLGCFLMQNGRPTAAVIQLRATVDSLRTMPASQTNVVLLGRVLSALGSGLTNSGAPSDGEICLREGVELLRAAPHDLLWELSIGLSRLAEARRLQGDNAQAEALWQEAVNYGQRVRGRDHPYVLMLISHWAREVAAVGRKEQAAALVDEVIAGVTKFQGPPRADVVSLLLDMSRLSRAENNLPAAERAARQAALRARTLPPGNLNWRAHAGVALAQVCIKKNLPADAVRLAGPIAAARLQFAAEADATMGGRQTDAIDALLAGDKLQCRERCAAILGEYEDSQSGLVALTTVTTCLWAPDSVAQTDRLIVLAERVVQQRPDEIEWRATRGAALYRDGQFAAAARELSPMVFLGSQFHLGTAHERFFLAMALAKIGKAKEAQHWLDSGKRWIAENSRLSGTASGEPGAIEQSASEEAQSRDADIAVYAFGPPPPYELRFWRLQELLEQEADAVLAAVAKDESATSPASTAKK